MFIGARVVWTAQCVENKTCREKRSLGQTLHLRRRWILDSGGQL
jgi:hypothetical protein